MNKSILVGRIANDIEVKNVGETKKATFNLAVRRTKDVADFIPVEVWDSQVDTLLNYSAKGMQIAIVGEIRKDSFNKQDGSVASKIYVRVNNLELLEFKNKDASAPANENIVDDGKLPF